MKGTPPAAVIYHATPRRAAYIHRHDDTWQRRRGRKERVRERRGRRRGRERERDLPPRTN